MAQRTEDSTMTSLRELMQLEQQRAEEDRMAKAHAESERRRRALEEDARAQADSVRRTLEVESAAQASASLARYAEERAERERADRELRVRLDVEHARRDAEQVVRLEHARRMAELEIGARGRGVSPVAVVGLIALALTGIGGLGVWMRAQMHAVPVASAPVVASATPNHDAELAALREQIRLNHVREQAAAGATIAPPAVRPARPACCGRHVHPRTTTGVDPLTGLDGPDPITAGGN